MSIPPPTLQKVADVFTSDFFTSAQELMGLGVQFTLSGVDNQEVRQLTKRVKLVIDHIMHHTVRGENVTER